MSKQNLKSRTGTVEREGTAERPSAQRLYRPDVDILETEDAIYVVADMPGVDEGSADVSLENNTLTIRGRVSATDPQGFTLTYAEYEPGNFERTFTVSDSIDRERIEATVKNGVLRLTLPKAREMLAKKIKVNAG